MKSCKVEEKVNKMNVTEVGELRKITEIERMTVNKDNKQKS